MPSLAEYDATRKGGAAATPMGQGEGPISFEDLLRRSDALTNRPSDPADPNPAPSKGQMPAEVAALQDPGPGTYRQEHPNTPIQETTNPFLAMLASGASTAGQTLKGAALSPFRAIAGLPSLPGQVAEGLSGQTGLPALAADPSLLGEAPAALKSLWDYIGANPEAGGDLLGQIAMGKMAPGAARAVPGAIEGGVNAVGRGVSAAGRGLTAAGEKGINSKVGGFGIPGLGALEAVFGSHPVAGIATAAAPYAAKYGGKLLERGGSALEGLKLTKAPTAPRAPSTEVPYQMEPSEPLVQDISQWEKTERPLGPGLAELKNTVARNTRTPEYRAELARSMDPSHVDPEGIAASVFDRMANEGQFAGQKALPRTPKVPPARPKPKGRDVSKIGGPSLASLRDQLVNKESLFNALREYQP